MLEGTLAGWVTGKYLDIIGVNFTAQSVFLQPERLSSHSQIHAVRRGTHPIAVREILEEVFNGIIAGFVAETGAETGPCRLVVAMCARKQSGN